MPIKVSVIVPVYNSEGHLEGSLGSLFAQTLSEIEVIAVNDASTDASAVVLEKIAETEQRLKVIHLSENVGVHEARAVGLKLASAPWVGFLDADDFAKPEMYHRLYEACDKHTADIAVCGIDLVNSQRQFLETKVCFQNDVSVNTGVWDTFCKLDFGTGSLCNKLYRKSLVMEHGTRSFRWRQDAGEDMLVNIGCFIAANSIRLIKAQLYDYVRHSENVTSKSTASGAFTQLFRAYALAVDIYGKYGRAILDEMTEMYAKQLNYDCYYVDQVADLLASETDLVQAVNLLAKKHPIGLAALVNKGGIGTLQAKGTEQPLAQVFGHWCHTTGNLAKLCIKAILSKITR